MYIKYNPNPAGRAVGDCAVRAVSKALKVDWESAFIMLAMNAFAMGDMPSSDSVWGATLRQNGFYRVNIPNTCPDCYTAEDFAADPAGSTQAEVIEYDSGTEFSAAIDGRYADEVLPILDDLMSTLQIVNPRLYASVMRKLEGDTI